MRSTRTVVTAVTFLATSCAGTLAGDRLQPALAKIEAQCPETYPAAVTALPGAGDLSGKSEGELLEWLGHWNPAMRAVAGRELARRGDAAIPALTKALTSDDAAVRSGATAALAGSIKEQLDNWQEYAPGITDQMAAQAKIRFSHAPIADLVLPLLTDSQSEVRGAALNFLVTLRLERDDVVSGILARCADDDDFIAQSAMIMLEKTFGVGHLDPQQFVPPLKHAMGSPLPRGRGHVVRMLTRMEEPVQREFIPELLAHLDWQPNRDTMFGAGGQEEALRLLTKFKVKELVPRIPKLLDKTMRGPGLFAAGLECAMEFGSDAKSILPDLNAYISRLEQELTDATRERDKVWRRERLSTLRKAVEHVEGI